ncbi:MAG: hypothetical protein WCA49_24335 [Candidatus Sulfotelmatobacter sp.]
MSRDGTGNAPPWQKRITDAPAAFVRASMFYTPITELWMIRATTFGQGLHDTKVTYSG